MNEELEYLKSKCMDDMFLGEDELDDRWVLVVDDDWVQKHKSQYSTCIFRHDPTGKYFAIHNCRQGSYHTDWYYSKPKVNEVEKVDVVTTITTWVPKK
jgi:hypothetical protein